MRVLAAYLLRWTDTHPCRSGVAASRSTIRNGSTSFRALLSIGVENPGFISRKANPFARFSNLALFIDRSACARVSSP